MAIKWRNCSNFQDIFSEVKHLNMFSLTSCAYHMTFTVFPTSESDPRSYEVTIIKPRKNSETPTGSSKPQNFFWALFVTA